MEKDYKNLLDRAYSELPDIVETHDRWQVPRPDVRPAGRRTVIMNFKVLSEEFRRDPEHLLKYLSGEMATLANFDGRRAIFQGRFKAESIRNLIDIYAAKYVVCPQCKRPDSKIVKEKRLYFLVCEACGAKSSIGTK